MNQLVVFRHVKIRWRLKNLVTVSQNVQKSRPLGDLPPVIVPLSMLQLPRRPRVV
jgi:hypothetical protein